MKKVVILGSTGSIGQRALQVARALPHALRPVALAVGARYKDALAQAEEFGIRHIAVADEAAADRCRAVAPAGMTIYAGAAGVEELAALPGADIVLSAMVGIAGLPPVLAALRQGTDVALANKEVLVAGGHLVEPLLEESGARLLPVDSEHNALFQCLDRGGWDTVRQRGRDVRRLLLTASGGPFRDRPDVDFNTVSREEVLNHPRWDMGPKVTVDSASMMNKGLEIMEARWLFAIPVERIDVVVHRESIVHSMVEFVDGGLLAQLSIPDMRFAIQHALTYPQRLDGALPVLDVARLGALHFEAPDEARFPCLALAREAARCGGSMPVVLNAANEIAVAAFLAGKLPFAGIWKVVEAVMHRHERLDDPTYELVMEVDRWAREQANEVCAP